MKYKLLTSALMACLSWQLSAANTVQQQWTLAGFDQPESVLYNPNSQELLISNINGSPIELNGKGYISRVSTAGEMLQKHWIIGLDAPKGMALFDDKLYVADMQKLHVIDINTAQLITSHLAAKSKMLNDISVDERGNVYVSDLLGGGVYRLKGDEFKQWLSADVIAHPNGLLVEGNSLYLASWGQGMHEDFSTDLLGKVYQLSLDDPSSGLTAVSDRLGNLDGLVRYKDALIVNDWINGKVFRIVDGKSELLFNAGNSAADISVHQDKLLVPVMFENRLEVYQLP